MFDNMRMMVLIGQEGISETKVFNMLGDLFWLYADNNRNNIEKYLMEVTHMRRNDNG